MTGGNKQRDGKIDMAFSFPLLFLGINLCCNLKPTPLLDFQLSTRYPQL